jgi:phosphonoacetaldehyde hydrolase
MSRIEMVVFDWAGTTVDYGSLAPVRVLTRIFEQNRVPVTDLAVRKYMGLAKRDHIQQILSLPETIATWQTVHGASPTAEDADRLYAEFIPAQLECLERYSTLIRGVPDVVGRLRKRGIKIGSTTGYTRPMLNLLLKRAADQGYVPDASLCPEDVGGGRPLPWMCYRLGATLGLSKSSVAVKVGDTPSDIEEGLNAGFWTIGVTSTGNQVGMSEEELKALPEAARCAKLDAAAKALLRAGAHWVVDSVLYCESALREIERRLDAGERP